MGTRSLPRADSAGRGPVASRPSLSPGVCKTEPQILAPPLTAVTYQVTFGSVTRIPWCPHELAVELDDSPCPGRWRLPWPVAVPSVASTPGQTHLVARFPEHTQPVAGSPTPGRSPSGLSVLACNVTVAPWSRE